MLHRLLLTLSLVLLFGFGQQGAVTHAISHFSEQQSQQHDKNQHGSTCDKCVVYAELSSAVAGTAFALPPASLAHQTPISHHTHATSALHLPYSARAPPFLA
jgi:hypothetical protein